LGRPLRALGKTVSQLFVTAVFLLISRSRVVRKQVMLGAPRSSQTMLGLEEAQMVLSMEVSPSLLFTKVFCTGVRVLCQVVKVVVSEALRVAHFAATKRLVRRLSGRL
jgi:hypothetical protein